MAWLISKTRLGLFVRRDANLLIASCKGVNTARIDTYAFALGSGIAGLAGCALSQVGNVGPDLGQGYIVDAFMVVVVGGVGQLAGTVYAALGLDSEQVSGRLGGCGAGQDCRAGADHHLYPETSARYFCHERPLGGSMIMSAAMNSISLPAPSPLLSCTGWGGFLVALIMVRAVAPVLNLLVPQGSLFHLSDYGVGLVGRIMRYAICALAMDLIWGFTGILSLGHGLFFALGGYAMGMYLMRQIGLEGNYKKQFA